MRDLIVRLEVVDDDTASALRVIDHFDRLVEERAPAVSVVRAAAAMAGCPAGLRDGRRRLTRRFTPDGRTLAADPEQHPPRTPVDIPGLPGSSLWLERSEPARPLDALILERAARAFQALAGDLQRPVGGLILLACDPDASGDDRQAAVVRLRLSGPVTVVVTTASTLPAPLCATVDGHTVALLTRGEMVPGGIRAGTALAEDPAQLPDAVHRARVALRLAGPGRPVVPHEELGILAVVVERFTPDEAADVEDVRRLEELRVRHPWVVETLSAVVECASLRRAATGLHLHHSTLQERLGWLTGQLGYSPTEGGGRQRAGIAVLLWRVAHSGDVTP